MDIDAGAVVTATVRRRVGVLISGRGSNLRALLAATGDPDYPAEIVLVVSNQADAHGLNYARRAGVATRVIDHRDFPGRQAFEAAMSAALESAGVELVCMAGFMRILTEGFVTRWANRLVNIHPSLLPAFSGLDTHARALAAGVKLHGCTVHLVRSELDNGPIIGQAVVPVLPDDTVETLGARVLDCEHLLYPRCLRLLAENALEIVDETIRIPHRRADSNARLVNPPV